MEILLNWLNHDVKLSQNIKDIDKQFQNGYLLGELLSKYNQILDFQIKFKNNNNKESIVKNFSQIEPVMNRLGIKFNINTAIDVMNSKNGTSCQLIRQLKDVLEQSYGTLDVNIVQNTGKQNKIFPLKKIDYRKSKYEKIQNQIFTKRLYNTIPPQQIQNLDKKLQKYEDMQVQIQQIKENEKRTKEIEKEQERVYNRQMMIGQLKRKMQFTSEWNNNSIKNHQKALHDGINRINMEKNFNKKCNRQLKQNIIAKQKKAEIDFKQQIDSFEVNLKNNNEKILQQNQNKGQLIEFLKTINNENCVQNMQAFKKQLSHNFQTENYKKERDRRLRKIIVDQKKQQIKKNCIETKDSFYKAINIHSQRENELYELIEKNQTYYNIFLDNVQLRDDMIKKQKEESQIQIENLHQEQQNQQRKHQEQYSYKQEKLYNALIEQKDLDKYYKKYNQAKEIAQKIIEGSLNIEETKQNLNYQKLPNDIWKINLQQNFQYESEQDYFRNVDCQNEQFLSFIFDNIISKIIDYQKTNKQKSTQNSNFETLTYKILILGLPYTDIELMQSYICDKFKLEKFDTQQILKEIIQSNKGIYYEQIMDTLKQGLQLQDIQLNQILIESIKEKFDDQTIQQHIDYIFQQIKQQQIVQKKIQSMDDINNTNFDSTQPLNFLKNLNQHDHEKSELGKNTESQTIQQNALQSEADQNSKTIKFKDLNKQNNKRSLRKIKSAIHKNSQDQKINMNQKIMEEYNHQGLICTNYPNTMNSLQNFEQQINGFSPQDQLTQTDIQKFVDIFNILYPTDQQQNSKYLQFLDDLKNQKQNVFFDLLIFINDDIKSIFQKAQKEEDSCQKIQNKFLHEKMLNKSIQMQHIESFYQYYVQKDQILNLNQNEKFHQLIEKIEEKIQYIKSSKQEKLKQCIQQKLQQQQVFETEKEIVQKLDDNSSSKTFASQENLNYLKQNLSNIQIESFSHSQLQKALNLLLQFLNQYYNDTKNILHNIKIEKIKFQQNTIKYLTHIRQQYYQEDILNQIVTNFIAEYNEFVKKHYDIFDQEEVLEELQFRLCNFEREITQMINQNVQESIEQEQNLSNSSCINNYICQLFLDVLKLSQNEIQKYSDEKLFIDLFSQEIIIEQTEDSKKKKNQNIEKTVSQQNDIQRKKLNLENIASNHLQEIMQSEKSYEIAKEKMNVVIENLISKLKLGDINLEADDNKKDKNQKNQDAQQSSQSLQNDIVLEIQTNTIKKLNYLKQMFVLYCDNIMEILNQQIDLQKCITQNYKQTLCQQVKNIIAYVSEHIEKESIIKNSIYFDNYNLIIDQKILLQKPEKKKQIIKNQPLQKDSIHIESMDKIFQNILNMRNSLMQVPKQMLNRYFQKIIQNEGNDLKLTQKWLNHNAKSYANVFNQFREMEDPNYIQVKPLLVYILLEEFKVPSLECLKFYREFAQKEKIMNYERFMRIKLFFEYDEQNEIIREEFQCQRFKFIKDKLYQLFEKEGYETMNFLSLVESMQYKMKASLLQKNQTFFDLLFKQIIIQMRIYLLRHGQTSYNTFQNQINKQFGLDYKFSTYYPFIGFLNKKELIDGELTEFGIKEARENGKSCKEKEKIKYVIVSPLARAIQTADIFFDSQNNKNIQFIVHPLLKSKFESQYDTPIKSTQNMNKYQNFNFDLLKELNSDNQDNAHWFLEDIVNPSIKNKLKKRVKDKKDDQFIQEILKFMEEIYPNQIESASDCVNRLFYFKKWLKRFIKEKQLKDHEICLVAHKTIFKYFTAQDFDDNLEPQDGTVLQNSILTSYELKQFNFDVSNHCLYIKISHY